MVKGLADFKILNKYSQFVSQAPKPIIRIVGFNPKTNSEKEELVFSPDETNVLQSYSFKYSTGDTDGQFSLTLYPGNVGIVEDEEKKITKEIPVFDILKPLQIVYIYERDKEYKIPDFVGVINRKKFVAQSGSGVRISITGKSVSSFISRFKISLDLNAMSLTNQMVSQEAVNIKLTAELSKDTQTVSTVLKTIWNEAVKMAGDYLSLSNPDMEKYVNKYLGNSFFDVENDLKINYPLASVFNGQNTVSFWDIVNGVIPFPVYEKFAYIDGNGKTKIKIREVPFDCSGDGKGSAWDSLEENETELDPAIVKSFDLEQSDDEVYTAFFSYITGSPIEQDKALRLAAQSDGYGQNEISIFEKKAAVYGYSPLTVSFNGYGKKETEYRGDVEKLTELNERLQNWYGHLDEMFKGTVTLATVLSETMPMCGEIVSFLGGEFYVNEVEHSWNYGGNPETKLTVSRGGDYTAKKFAPLENVTKRYSIFRKLLENATNAKVNIL